jgi:Uma2 family endonuclease
MATASHARTAEAPTLESGDRMDRAEFHRRYSCRPDLKRAELVDGVVYVASPVRIPEHADPHAILMGVLGSYRLARSGVFLSDNGTWLVDDLNEVQPDAILRFARARGGTSWIDEHHYLRGVPELVAEVAGSSYAIDLNRKKDLYLRAGVREYIVWQTEDGRIDWWRNTGGEWVAIEPDASGTLHSTVFEGLALRPAELLERARESADEAERSDY